MVFRFWCIILRRQFINVKINGVDYRKIFWSQIMICFRGFFEFIKFFSSIVLLFLSSFVLCCLCSIVNVYCAISDLIRVFFSLSSCLKKYTLLCKIFICDLSDLLTLHAPGELRFTSRLQFSRFFETSFIIWFFKCANPAWSNCCWFNYSSIFVRSESLAGVFSLLTIRSELLFKAFSVLNKEEI